MSVEEQTPTDPLDNENLATAFGEFDKARQGLFEASATYVRRPVKPNAVLLLERANGVAGSLSRFTECVIDDDLMDAAQKGEVIASTQLDDDERRVKFFNGLFGNNDSGPFEVGIGDKQNIAKNIEDALDTVVAEDRTDDLANKLVDDYGTNLSVDLNLLFELCSNSSRAKVLRRCESIGRHSLDIFKLSAGIAIGGALVREWDRLRS